MDCSGYFVRSTFRSFFYDWEYFRNHLIEILLPVRENSGGSLFGFITGWEFTGYQGLAESWCCYFDYNRNVYFSKKYITKPLLWILDRVVIAVASGAIFL
jgi:hypothetical protein